MAHKISEYGDIYVVKDSLNRYFVEFNWVDDERYPGLKTAQDICEKIVEDRIFGKKVTRGSNGETIEIDNLVACMPYLEGLRFRKSLHPN